MKQKIDKSTWNRKGHLEFFSAFQEPFFGITTTIDCTIAYEKAKEMQISFFVYYLHKTIAAVNQIENSDIELKVKMYFYTMKLMLLQLS